MSDFVHLYIHSHYSLLNALPKIPELVNAAKENGMTALALTDSGNLYGAIEFYKECIKSGIKPILGLDAYLAQRSRLDKQHGIDNKRTRLVLLAKNLEGYRNLIKLVTISHFDGFYYKPRIDKELLEKHKEGLICISPFLSSEIGNSAGFNDYEKALEVALWYKNIFGEDFYQEITHHPELNKQKEKIEFLQKLSKETDIPIVASQEVYYLKSEDKAARDTLLAVQNNGERFSKSADDNLDFSFINGKQAEKYFKNIPEAIENSKKIADKCNVVLELGKWVFPDYKLDAGKNHNQELRELVYSGLKKRGLELTPEVNTRIDYELEIIKNKGYSPYFLVVADLLKFARENKIFSTTRGSAAGSMVSFLTFITTVNPIEYELPFERFLNPERPSPPDIDMDFADSRRDEVISYAKRKYGEDKVAQIGTFGTMMARGSVRDVARALNFPYTVGDRISKLIPLGAQGFPMTIDKALAEVPELKKIYKEEKDVKEIINMAKKIEGCARHISVHAAGVVISPTPITDFTPVQFDPKGEGKIITQFDMHSVEDAGLLKFDFLGIKNLSILADAVTITRKMEKKEIDIENIPLDDKKTFEMLSRGETGGLFQLNGSGLTRYLKELKPERIHDINAMVALYRPGPLESIPSYIERKKKTQVITYLDPRMEEILSQSYGVITYQDDVMMIAIKLAGYSWMEADKLRKAMGKKIPAEMEAQKEKLLTGLVKNGMKKEKAEKLWALIEPFAAYGFNKAHAASYGKVAYQTAYMKANFPTIYMSAVLSADSGDIEKIAEIVAECKRMNIAVLPPNVNESFGGFTALPLEDEKAKIRFGLNTIKNFGEGIAQTIIEERKKNGKYKTLTDFLTRLKDRNLNKKSMESLIKSGALDDLGERGEMLNNLENILIYLKEKNKESQNNQSSIFGIMENVTGSEELGLTPGKPAGKFEKLVWEKELLGLYISGHPLDQFDKNIREKFFKIKAIKAPSSPAEASLETDTQVTSKTNVVIGGIIEDIKKINTKKGDEMLFLKISDYTDSIECVIFPRVLAEAKDIIKLENCVVLRGSFSERNGRPSVVVEKIKLISPDITKT